MKRDGRVSLATQYFSDQPLVFAHDLSLPPPPCLGNSEELILPYCILWMSTLRQIRSQNDNGSNRGTPYLFLCSGDLRDKIDL